jgi:putative ABC transport system permease protein
MSQRHGPPALLERCVEACIGRDASTLYVLGDLREEYLAMRSRHSGVTAGALYVLEGTRVAVRLRWERRHRPRTGGSPAARDGVFGDVRHALRFFRRRPGFAAAIVMTVALAVSSTTVAFAIVNGVLLEPLAYRSPDRLVALWETNPRGNRRNVVSTANFLAWRDELHSFDALAALTEGSGTLLYGGVPERVGVVVASAAYFEVVGAEPLFGRLYDDSDDEPGADPVAVLSEGFWRRRFGADRSIVGRTLHLGDRTVTVVGVLPERFDFDIEWAFSGVGSHDVWRPPMFPPAARDAGGRYLEVIGRLAPGVSAQAAGDEANALAQRLADQFPERDRGWGVNVVPLHADLVGDARQTILVVFGAVCFVLLVACANVANLILTRANERQQEFGVRVALGASRVRMVRQLLVEGAALSMSGGALGLLLAWWGVHAVVAAAPDIPRIESVSLDPRVVSFALVATIGTALLFGLAPALRLPRAGNGVARTSASRETRRLRRALAIGQVALSLVLLVGAGLLVRSLVNRLDTGVGFGVHGVVTADVQLGAAYGSEVERADFFEQLVARARAIPGVASASAITWPPLAGGGTRTSFWPLDRPAPEPGEAPGADIRWVQRDYRKTLGIPLLEGRFLGPQDDADAPMAVVVNETGARTIWPGESAVGKRIAMPWGDTLVAEVVGVVGDVRDLGPDTPPYPMFYWDHRQFEPFNQMSLVARTAEGETATAVAGMRAALADLDPAIPLYNVHTMQELFDDAVRRARFATESLGIFALVALLLASIGIYGVMAQVTEARTREIGIRMALGASRRSILGLVLTQGMAQIVVAVALGGAGALALTRFLRGLVFDVSTADPTTFVATALLLMVVGLVACWLPARRASRVDPVEAVREA